MNTNNVIDFASRKKIPTPEPEPENLLDITYSNVDEAFEVFLLYMSEDLGYREMMTDNEDLEILMGYILTVMRSAWAHSCDLEDSMTSHIIDIIKSVKQDLPEEYETPDLADITKSVKKDKDDDSC